MLFIVAHAAHWALYALYAIPFVVVGFSIAATIMRQRREAAERSDDPARS